MTGWLNAALKWYKVSIQKYTNAASISVQKHFHDQMEYALEKLIQHFEGWPHTAESYPVDQFEVGDLKENNLI